MESTKKVKDQAETTNQSTENRSTTSKSGAGEQPESSTLGNLGANLTAKSGEIVDQAKGVAADVYNRASKGVNEGVTQALDYGRENPGKATLIAFGAGLGVGLVLAGAFTPQRTRTSRIVPPVLNAISEIASEIFR